MKNCHSVSFDLSSHVVGGGQINFVLADGAIPAYWNRIPAS